MWLQLLIRFLVTGIFEAVSVEVCTVTDTYECSNSYFLTWDDFSDIMSYSDAPSTLTYERHGNSGNSLPEIIITVVSLSTFFIGVFVGVVVGALLDQKWRKIKKIKTAEDKVIKNNFPVYETVELKEQTEMVDMACSVAYGKVNCAH